MFKNYLKRKDLESICFRNGDIELSFKTGERTIFNAKFGFESYSKHMEEAFHYHQAYHWEGNDHVIYALKQIKKDDEIYLRWQANGGQNDYVKNAGLNVDCLYLHATEKKGKMKIFLIAYDICPTNSSNMIKRVI